MGHLDSILVSRRKSSRHCGCGLEVTPVGSDGWNVSVKEHLVQFSQFLYKLMDLHIPKLAKSSDRDKWAVVSNLLSPDGDSASRGCTEVDEGRAGELMLPLVDEGSNGSTSSPALSTLFF